ncbi:OTUD3 [Mytilus coruscus]|uniref:OTUD3 n=1 Tax=Mytilus coruscus TaxID=42192 RepID=A0A6J8BNI0_MYTCO|nr:OTUD3 [Mytilus coruscus]
MDVFTRFVWLRPLSDKSSEKVAAKLCEIYAELGNTKILQSDQGSEFKVHSSLGISPYECLLGIKPNSVTQKCNFTNTNIEDIPIEFATESNMTFKPSEDCAERIRQIKKVRSQAFNISKKASANMQKHGLAKFPPSECSIGDEVYVKFIGKDKRVYRGGASIAAPRVLEGIVIAANKDLHKYKVKYTTQEKIIYSDWFRELNDIITESRLLSTSYKEALHDKMIGLQQNAAKEDLHVDRDIPSDGNCMFHELSLQLSRVGVQISYTRLRHMIVDFLHNNPVLDFSDGTVDFRDFTVDVDWNGYLENMERDGESDNNTVLVAAACLFRISILISS